MITRANAIRVLMVDDHPLMREGIAGVLSKQTDMVLAAEASHGREAIERFRVLRPDVTLMDLKLPDINGIEVIEAIRHDYPDAKIIALTTYKGDVRIGRALRAGASAYLLKSMLRTELLQTIRMVHAGRRHMPSEIASEIAEHAFDETLSDREVEVLREIAAGHANKMVAFNLSITEGTVKKHMKSILIKLSATDRTQAVMIALKRGFLEM